MGLPRSVGNRALRVETLESRQMLNATVIISEFMAGNDGSLLDGDGESSDWIEIYNSGNEDVNMQGWHLTDDALDLQKWHFPNVDLRIGEYLVVFASGQNWDNYVDPAGYLHTTFKLAARGEYLALVEPNGQTIATEFAPEYSTQVTDYSYGTAMDFTANDLLPVDAQAELHVPSDGTLGTAWTQHDFLPDANWATESAPGVPLAASIGYDTKVGIDGLIASWPFDESSGAVTAADVSGRGFDGLVIGSPTFEQPGANAETGTAMHAAGSRVDVPFDPALNPASFTFSIWVRVTGGAGHRSVVTSRYDGLPDLRGFTLYATPGNAWSFWTGRSGGWDELDGPAITNDVWTHLAISFDAATNTKSLFVNGQEYSTTTQGYRPNHVRDLHIGAGNDFGTQFSFVGDLDDAGLYHRALDSTEIQQVMARGIPESPGVVQANPVRSDLTANWRLDEPLNVQVVSDATVHGHTGWSTGGVTFAVTGRNVFPDMAAAFDNGSIDVPYNARLNPESFTAATWVKPSASGDHRAVITSRYDALGTQGFILYKTPGNTWSFWTGGGRGAWETLDGPAVVNGVWTHLAISYDAATHTKTLYVNGDVAATTVDQRYVPNALRALHIGAGGDTGAQYRFVGAIDDVGLWSSALSEADIEGIMADGVPDEPVSSYDPLITDDVETAMRGVNASTYVRVPFDMAGPADFDSLVLSIKYDDGFVAYINGQEVASRGAPVPVLWNSSATARHPDWEAIVSEEIVINDAIGYLREGANVLAIHGLNRWVDDADFLTIPQLRGRLTSVLPGDVGYFDEPTPGHFNPNSTVFVGPSIGDVVHEPHEPTRFADVTVEATVADMSNSVGAVALYYRVHYGTETPVDMLDDGTGADRNAGDGVFTGVIPGGTADVGQMVRYRIEAADTVGTLSESPAQIDLLEESQSARYFGYVISAGLELTLLSDDLLSIAVVNPSFEDVVNPAGSFNGWPDVAGWNSTTSDYWQAGSQKNANPVNFTEGIDGNRFAHINAGSGCSLYQDTGVTFVAGTTYTLTVGVGRRTDHDTLGYDPAGWEISLNYADDGTSVATTGGTTTVGGGGVFKDEQVVYVAATADVGREVQIRLTNTNLNQPSATNFENVRLTVAPAPLSKYLVPGDGSLGSNWTDASFDDSGWTDAYGSVGYELTTGIEDYLLTDVAADMAGLNGSIYVRRAFDLGDPAEIRSLGLHVRYDDGFVAYLNGVEVARRGYDLPGTPPFNATATAVRDDDDVVLGESIDLSAALASGVLLSGPNVLAIHGLNFAAGDDDFLLSTELVATTGVEEEALPRFQWFTDDYTGAHERVGARASVYYAGEFYDNVFVRERGQATNSGSQKFIFGNEHPFLANDEMGRVHEINLNAQGADASFVRQSLAYDSFRNAGVPSPISYLTLMEINGLFDRVGVFIEQVDEDFLKRNDMDPDGTLYKFVQRSGVNPTTPMTTPALSDVTNGVEKKSPKDDGDTEFLDLQAVVDGLALSTLPERTAFVFDNFDVPRLINYLAARIITQDVDSVRKNFYMYRDTDGTGLWLVLPWDKDMNFGVTGGADGYGFAAHPFLGDYEHLLGCCEQWSVLFDVVFNVPETREMYLRRIRTLMDGLLQEPDTLQADGLMEQQVDAIFDGAEQYLGGAVGAVQDLKDYFGGWRENLFVGHTVGGTDAEPAGIPAAQVGNPIVEIAGFDQSPAGGDQDREYIALSNPDATASIDISGWSLRGGVEFTFAPGTVIPAGGVAYVSPDVAAFRTRTESPTAGAGLFVVGNYSGHLSNRGELVELVAADGQMMDDFTTAILPTDAQKFLRVSEVMYHPNDPTPAEEAFGFVDDDDFEFIEFINTSETVTLDLTGVSVSVAFDYTLPDGTMLAPGQRLVLPRYRDAFEMRYGEGIAIDDEYRDPVTLRHKLDNDGETIKIDDADGSTIQQFRYNDNAAWPAAADGAGSSLEVVNTAGDLDGPATWYASVRPDGSPGLAASPAVLARRLFYGGSPLDSAGNDAVAPDKTPLMPGMTATAAHYSNYVEGITGIMVDLANPVDYTGIGDLDFAFHVGNNDDPASWDTEAPDATFSVRPGEGVGGSDRVAVTWPDGSIANQWLQVSIGTEGSIGLLDADVFYFGSAPGDTVGGALGAGLPTPPMALVNAADVIAVRNNPHAQSSPADPANPFDVNRDGQVDALDAVLARNEAASPLSALRLITAPQPAAPAPSSLPEAEGEDAIGPAETRTAGASGVEYLQDGDSQTAVGAIDSLLGDASTVATLQRLLRRSIW